MKQLFLLSFVCCASLFTSCQQTKVSWVSTSETSPFTEMSEIETTKPHSDADIVIDTTQKQQQMWGFGACFNELGKTSLDMLTPQEKESIFKELFAPGVGASFTICRMPIAANDFARDWYSYNETDGDFAMENFSIDNDKETLIPFIKEAKKYCPDLKIWASPWSPPSWMKTNKHYALAMGYNNGLDKTQQGREGADFFIQDPKYLESYALYFEKFIKAYREQGIEIFAVAPQNEFNSCQIFPSCTWTAGALSNFIGNYLGPKMENLGVEVMFGTMERPNHLLVDTILTNEKSGKYVKTVGFQWAGKGAIEAIHNKYPDLTLIQSESECGDGKNDWAFAQYTWDQMKHYMKNGASSYFYWNISLIEDGLSRWGWRQNSLITVNSDDKSYKYNHEYYLMKHFSKFVKPGASYIDLAGTYDDAVAFTNPDGSIVLIAANKTNEPKELTVNAKDKGFKIKLEPGTFNTYVVAS